MTASTLDRQVNEAATRMVRRHTDVVMTVAAWASVGGFGALIGLVAFVAGAR